MTDKIASTQLNTPFEISTCIKWLMKITQNRIWIIVKRMGTHDVIWSNTLFSILTSTLTNDTEQDSYNMEQYIV